MYSARVFLIDFLRRLEQAIPPPENCHHAITYGLYMTEDGGFEDQLCLQVNRDGLFTTLFLDNGDFVKDPEILAAEIVSLMPLTTEPQEPCTVCSTDVNSGHNVTDVKESL